MLKGIDTSINSSNYEVSNKETVLYPLIENNDVLIVAGSFFGDEGKGKTVDAIARHPNVELIVRANSGENAGHTIVNNGNRFVFNLAPSGLLIPGKKNLIGSECVMDPVNFIEKEIGQLVKNNIDYSNLFVGNVQIVTPYHKLMDLLGNPTNSSTLKGISPVHASKVTKRGLRLDNLFNSKEEQAIRLEKDLQPYYGLLKTQHFTEEDILKISEEMNSDRIRVPDHVLEFLEAKNKVSYLYELFNQFVVQNTKFPQRTNSNEMLKEVLVSGKKVLLEGPQSYFLSNSVESHWGSSTSANTTAAGIMAAAGYNFTKYKTVVINVHKSPASSRVGIGANPSGYVKQDYFSQKKINSVNDLEDICNDFDSIQKMYFVSIDENGLMKEGVYSNLHSLGAAMAISSAKHHGEFGATTGKPRICGLFDCVAHHQVNSVQGPYLTISAMDRGDDYDQIGLVVGYLVNLPEGKTMFSNGTEYQKGDLVKCGDKLPNEQVLYHCQPIIKIMPGWKGQPIAADQGDLVDHLPQQVQNYIGAIEHFTGAKVISIGNGPDTENLIYFNKK